MHDRNAYVNNSDSHSLKLGFWVVTDRDHTCASAGCTGAHIHWMIGVVDRWPLQHRAPLTSQISLQPLNNEAYPLRSQFAAHRGIEISPFHDHWTQNKEKITDGKSLHAVIGHAGIRVPDCLYTQNDCSSPLPEPACLCTSAMWQYRCQMRSRSNCRCRPGSLEHTESQKEAHPPQSLLDWLIGHAFCSALYLLPALARCHMRECALVASDAPLRHGLTVTPLGPHPGEHLLPRAWDD